MGDMGVFSPHLSCGLSGSPLQSTSTSPSQLSPSPVLPSPSLSATSNVSAQPATPSTPPTAPAGTSTHTTSSIQLSLTTTCDIYRAGPCRAGPDQPSETLTWKVQWDATTDAEADIRNFKVGEVVGAPYAEAVAMETDGMEMWVPIGIKGYLAAATRAVEVPGTFTDCGDGKEYQGRVLVPSSEGVTCNVVLVS